MKDITGRDKTQAFGLTQISSRPEYTVRNKPWKPWREIPLVKMTQTNQLTTNSKYTLKKESEYNWLWLWVKKEKNGFPENLSSWAGPQSRLGNKFTQSWWSKKHLANKLTQRCPELGYSQAPGKFKHESFLEEQTLTSAF